MEELTQLFEGEPLGGASGQFRDVAFDIYRRGPDGVALGSALMLGGGLFAAAAAGGSRQGDMGHFVRVWLSSPLGMDLLVQSRDEEDEREDGWACSCMTSARRSTAHRRFLCVQSSSDIPPPPDDPPVDDLGTAPAPSAQKDIDVDPDEGLSATQRMASTEAQRARKRLTFSRRRAAAPQSWRRV